MAPPGMKRAKEKVKKSLAKQSRSTGTVFGVKPLAPGDTLHVHIHGEGIVTDEQQNGKVPMAAQVSANKGNIAKNAARIARLQTLKAKKAGGQIEVNRGNIAANKAKLDNLKATFAKRQANIKASGNGR